MKANLIDLLNGNGFTEKPAENEILQSCNGLILQREWSKETEVVWYGKRTETFSVQVFINRKSTKIAGKSKAAGTIPSESAPTMPSLKPSKMPGLKCKGGFEDESENR